MCHSILAKLSRGPQITKVRGDEFNVVLLRTASGQIASISALILDVTERWTGGRALKQRLRELEAELRKVRDHDDLLGASPPSVTSHHQPS
jgi:hypothetical protein